MDVIEFRSSYNYDRLDASKSSGLACFDVTRTKQAHKEECDINTIVRRFGITGQLPTNVRMPSYGDYDMVSDYHSAMNAVAESREAFEAMPAHVRARFQNDPGAFLDFCSDAGNRAEAIKLGLVPSLPSVPIVPVKPPEAVSVAVPAVPGGAATPSTQSIT